jgi:hypothetical protein
MKIVDVSAMYFSNSSFPFSSTTEVTKNGGVSSQSSNIACRNASMLLLSCSLLILSALVNAMAMAKPCSPMVFKRLNLFFVVRYAHPPTQKRSINFRACLSICTTFFPIRNASIAPLSHSRIQVNRLSTKFC